MIKTVNVMFCVSYYNKKIERKATITKRKPPTCLAIMEAFGDSSRI